MSFFDRFKGGEPKPPTASSAEGMSEEELKKAREEAAQDVDEEGHPRQPRVGVGKDGVVLSESDLEAREKGEEGI